MGSIGISGVKGKPGRSAQLVPDWRRVVFSHRDVLGCGIGFSALRNTMGSTPGWMWSGVKWREKKGLLVWTGLSPVTAGPGRSGRKGYRLMGSAVSVGLIAN